MKIAAAAYPLDRLDSWAAYDDKLSRWVAEAATAGADLLVFPEYAAMELAALAGSDAAADLEGCKAAVSDRLPEADAIHARLATDHGVHILAGSAPAAVPGGHANRARFFAPGRDAVALDKQIMTRFEREHWGIVPAGPLALLDTALGRIGVLICYDAEFPLLARALVEAGAEVLLVPSCTEEVSGYSRVRIGAMARALENQCVAVHAPLLGAADWCPPVDMNRGAAALYGPPDLGFPETGVIAEGTQDTPAWTIAEVDRATIETVRRDGRVLNHRHWDEQGRSVPSVQTVSLT